MARLLFLLLVILFSQKIHAQEISLDGKWRFAIDKDNKGLSEKWYEKKLVDFINLPGSMTENRKGDEVTLNTKWIGSIYDSSFFFRPSLAKYREPNNLKIPFWLTPIKHYVGIAWYQREIDIPKNWNNKRIILFLERAHIETKVWIDQKEVGTQNSLVAPHTFELSPLTPGQHIITIRIDNAIADRNVGPDSHSVTDHTQGDWNGIVGKIYLTATSPVYIDDVQVYPDVARKQARVVVTIANTTGDSMESSIQLLARSFNSKIVHVTPTLSKNVTIPAHHTLKSEVNLVLGDQMLLWDEFNPALYEMTISVNAGSISNAKRVQFGMREIKAVGNKIQLNGRTIHLRGDVNNCEFPLTGYAPMDEAAWSKLFRTLKSFGFNHVRFHSWCPPEAAFLAADKIGIYLQPEGPTWANHGTSLGDGRFIDEYLYEETNRMLKWYGNHPSFCFLAAGNEPAGRNHAKYLDDYVNYWRPKDNRRLFTAASVAMSWPLYPSSDYMIKSGPRGLNWDKVQPETMSDYHNIIESFSIPYITHEMGQWCVFPDFKEIKEYTGVTRAKNFELFQEDFKDHDMENLSEKFLMASGKLQAVCYKEEIEKSLRTKNSAGFQLLGLQDFPGQGTALVGVLNPFYEEKGYLTAKEWTRFCYSTVILSRIPRFTYTNNENFEAEIEVYHYGAIDLKNAIVRWKIKDEHGKEIGAGEFPAHNIATGGNSYIGKVSWSLRSIGKPTKLNLEASIEKSLYVNDWNFWVYPKTLTALTPGIYYTDTLDRKAEQVLEKGGKVFLNAAGKIVKGKEVVQYFTPVFWNTSWFKMHPPHTLGFLLDPAHPAFAHFPTSYHSDLQWWEIVNKAQVMNLEEFPKGFRPLVQSIDTWFLNRKLGMIFEARVGNGKIIVSSADLISDTAHRIVARQLLFSLQQYMKSNRFDPQDRVDIKVLRNLFNKPSKEVWTSFSRAVPDELRSQGQKK